MVGFCKGTAGVPRSKNHKQSYPPGVAWNCSLPGEGVVRSSGQFWAAHPSRKDEKKHRMTCVRLMCVSSVVRL